MTNLCQLKCEQDKIKGLWSTIHNSIPSKFKYEIKDIEKL